MKAGQRTHWLYEWVPVAMDTLRRNSSAAQCGVYRARNYSATLIGSSSLTRHRTFHAIGPLVQLWRVVVISNLRLAVNLRDLVAPHVVCEL